MTNQRRYLPLQFALQFTFAGLLVPPLAWSGAPLPTSSTKETVPPKSRGYLNDLLLPQTSAWDIGGQLRARYELKQGAGSFPDRDFIAHGFNNDNDYLMFREKLHIGWEAEPWLRFYVEGRGSQAVSDQRDPSPEQDVWDIQQAYVQLGGPATSDFTLRLGRQDLVYGDQRFIGNGDWGTTGRSFDAAWLRYNLTPQSWIDVFTGRVVIPRDGYLNQSNDYDQFSGIYASSRDLWNGVETQAFFLARNVAAGSPNAVSTGLGGPSERDVYTYGVRLKSQPGAFDNWDFTFEGAGQFGDVVSSGVERSLRTFALTGNAGYTFNDVWGKPRFGLGYDYGSGDSNSKDGRHETFEPLFGTNHNFYGVMDLIGLRNLNSPRASISIKPSKKLSLSADYLAFWLADNNDSFYPESGAARSANGYGRNPYNSYVGSELDLVAKYTLTEGTELHLGYGHFFAGNYIERSLESSRENGGAKDANWFYVQAAISF